ncbi:MAG: DUF3501 family protein [Alphaproteobacteria bacterium]|jgi:hypothetical protein|nr:DUF3501 family protein [Alphaproteobacteria bacterium]MDP6516265.1 DUF3501 family protein [Alphaproteobacteria bacterium]
MAKPLLTPDDIMAMDAYAKVRHARRQSIAALKRHRRVAVGPDVTFYFENWDTMWMQVHEMLYADGGGQAQIAGELDAYNPLIPKGRELVATMMIEIDEPSRRDRVLAGLGGIEATASLRIDGEAIAAVPEAEIERTTAAGKTSSVHFLHFPFSAAQIARFRAPETEVILGLAHPNYGHMAVLSGKVRGTLAADFDP